MGVLALALLAALIGIFISVSESPVLIAFSLVLLCCYSSFAAYVASKVEGPSVRRVTQLAAFLLVVALALFGFVGAEYVGVRGFIISYVAVVLLIPVVRGIKLLRTRWSGRAFFLSWLLVLVPVLLPWLLGAGTTLHAFYGSQFHVPSDRLEISAPQRFFASVDVLAHAVLFMTLSLACWGYLGRVIPLMHDVIVPVVAFIFIALTSLVFMLVTFDPALSAAEGARRDWGMGRVPKEYYGVSAEPTCLTPVTPSATIPGYGRRLSDRVVYAYFGTVDGNSIFWNPKTDKSFRVPSDDVRITPATSDRPGESIPKGCP
jgi:hypothetical protein